jgi:hypothetical protein
MQVGTDSSSPCHFIISALEREHKEMKHIVSTNISRAKADHLASPVVRVGGEKQHNLTMCLECWKPEIFDK